MNGHVDRSDRAILKLLVRPSHDANTIELNVWIDTAFTGELVIPRQIIDQLKLPQSSAVMAGLADGTEVLLETFSCMVDWFGEKRVVEVVESTRELALLGIGLLRGCKLEIDYRLRTLAID